MTQVLLTDLLLFAAEIPAALALLRPPARAGGGADSDMPKGATAFRLVNECESSPIQRSTLYWWCLQRPRLVGAICESRAFLPWQCVFRRLLPLAVASLHCAVMCCTSRLSGQQQGGSRWLPALSDWHARKFFGVDMPALRAAHSRRQSHQHQAQQQQAQQQRQRASAVDASPAESVKAAAIAVAGAEPVAERKRR